MKILSPTSSWKNVDNANRLEYFDKNLHTHWYWQDVAQEIVKCHLGLAEGLPRFIFWKWENSPIFWNEWNNFINFCVNIDMNKIYPKRLRNDIKPISWKLLCIKVTPDLHLTYSKSGGNLGLVFKMKNIACISILLTKHVKYFNLYLFKFVLYNIVAFKAN